MRQVSVTELRSNLPAYLGRVREGEEVWITSRGKVIARLVPALDRKEEAREHLLKLRERCDIRDVISPIGEVWDARNGHP